MEANKTKASTLKKVLIVAYYWPPAGGPGVQRWLKFVTYLPNFGIEPIVYIPENPSYPLIDHELVDEIPEDVEIIKHPIFEPYNLASVFGGKESVKISSGIIPPESKQTLKQKLVLWTRGNFFIPDARKFWIKPSIKVLSKVLKEKQINTVITTGPPHSLHLIGLGLKQKMNINWIADFRDPWTNIGYHKKLRLTNTSIKKHEYLEKQVLQNADKLIVTSKSTKKEFAGKVNTKIEVITNGFEYNKKEEGVLDAEFSISHIGSLLSKRNPEILWESLGELIKENELFRENFVLKLAGVVSKTITDTIKKYGFWNHVKLLGYISHKEALQLQQKSQVLLLIEVDSEETKMIIPGKLFEYLQSERPILGLGPKNADFKEIIEETNTGTFFNYCEKENVKKEVLNLFTLYLNKQLKVEAKDIEKYTRKNLTKQLAKYIKEN